MIKKERHVLIVLPHPDDEAFGISGTDFGVSKNGRPRYLRMSYFR